MLGIASQKGEKSVPIHNETFFRQALKNLPSSIRNQGKVLETFR